MKSDSIKVFISWSGNLSKMIAKELNRWIPSVLQNVDTYFSPEDTEKGSQWSNKIRLELDSSDIGIICLTRENLNRPWILFEAGAISKKFDEGRVCSIVFDLETTDVTGPLLIFQLTSFSRDEMLQLLKTINGAGQSPLEVDRLTYAFEMAWPSLESAVTKYIKEDDDSILDEEVMRTDRSLLEEMLDRIRRDQVKIDRIEKELKLIRNTSMDSRSYYYVPRRGSGSTSALPSKEYEENKQENPWPQITEQIDRILKQMGLRIGHVSAEGSGDHKRINFGIAGSSAKLDIEYFESMLESLGIADYSYDFEEEKPKKSQM